jgi:hypothetical protein
LSESPTATRTTGGVIRTISVSLIAIAAVAASVLFSKARQPRPVEDEVQSGPVEGAISLDAIRQAGF